MQGLASKPRVAGTVAEGSLVPFAEVDIRTSIRPTVAEIDLGAVQRNLIRFRERVGRSVAVFAVVKADAFGKRASNKCQHGFWFQPSLRVQQRFEPF